MQKGRKSTPDEASELSDQGEMTFRFFLVFLDLCFFFGKILIDKRSR